MPAPARCAAVFFPLLLLAAGPALPVHVEEVLPGKTAGEIVLSAPGGDEPGRRVVIAAAADLRRTPLRHTVRVVLFDGSGSEGWLRGLGPGVADRILAHLSLERIGGRGSAGPVIEGSPAMPPGWLVHSVLKSGGAVRWPFAVADDRYSFLGQLVVRSLAVRHGTTHGTTSEPFLERGIPSATLSGGLLADAARREPDPGRLDRWAQAVAAAVRRLDALPGRPLPEDQYLAAGGSVFLRRDLIWAGFLLWVLLVFRGRPGPWRGTSADEHGRQMRSYLPGFLFRVLLLLAIFLAPVFSVLLLPAAALALAPPRVWAPRVWISIAAMPFVFYLAAVGVGLVNGIVSLDGGFRGGAAAALLIPATFAAYVLMIARGRLTVDDSPGKVEP